MHASFLVSGVIQYHVIVLFYVFNNKIRWWRFFIFDPSGLYIGCFEYTLRYPWEKWEILWWLKWEYSWSSSVWKSERFWNSWCYILVRALWWVATLFGFSQLLHYIWWWWSLFRGLHTNDWWVTGHKHLLIYKSLYMYLYTRHFKLLFIVHKHCYIYEKYIDALVCRTFGDCIYAMDTFIFVYLFIHFALDALHISMYF